MEACEREDFLCMEKMEKKEGEGSVRKVVFSSYV
jgi:hypothetical protein